MAKKKKAKAKKKARAKVRDLAAKGPRAGMLKGGRSILGDPCEGGEVTRR
jgi:hypothetical protein